MKYPVIHTMEQGSDEWFAVRLGKVTASQFKLVMGSSQGKDTYMYGLISEARKQTSTPSIKTKAMDNGTELEPYARDHYSKITGNQVQQVGFVEMSDYIGVSPDGLIGEDGLLEIKCPITTTHMRYIDKDVLPTAYKEQVYGQLWVTGRKWCDFVSFDPTWDDHVYWRIRVERDEKEIDKIESKVNIFVDKMMALRDKMINNRF